MKQQLLFFINLVVLAFSMQGYAQPPNYSWDRLGMGNVTMSNNAPVNGFISNTTQASEISTYYLVQWNEYANKWSNTSTPYNQEFTLNWGGGSFNGPDGVLTNATTLNRFYTLQIEGLAYANRNAVIMETDNAPIVFSATPVSPASPSVFPSQDLNLTITLAGNKSAQERAFVRYTDNNFATSQVLEVSFASSTASTGTATIPGAFNTAGKSVIFYVYSTTVAATAASNHDLITLNLANNGGSNYSYTVASSWTTSGGSSNFNDAAAWDANEVPPANQVLTIEDDLNLDTNYTASSITVNSGFTLTINASQTLTMTGGISGAGALTVDGTLQIDAGGFTTIAPTYNSGSTLVYSTNNTYGRGAEWSATSGLGFPHHVTITNGTVLDLGANSGNMTEKRCGGVLTIASGATINMELFDMQAPLNVRGNVVNNGTLILSDFNLGDLFVGGNFTQNGTLTNNGRAVFFDGAGAQTVGGSATPIIFDYLRIDKLGTSLIFEEDIEVTQTLGGNGYEQTDGLVTISAGKSLTVQNGNGTFEIDAGSFTLESTSTDYATLVVGIVNRASGATINYNRFVNEIGSTAGSGNDLVSPVFSGQTFDDFATENSGVLAASGAIRAFAPFDKTTGAYANFNAADTDALISGKGYRAATDVVDGATLTFTGDVVTTSPVSIAISNSGPAFAEWNLVGNPYPFFISATAFLDHAQNTAVIDSEAFAVYGYNSGTYSSGPTIGSYTIINSISNPSLTIAPGQGFFVASNTTGGNIEFTTSMRTTPGSDDFIIGRSSPVESTYINLEMAANEPYRTYIYFNDESTRGLDIGFDAATFGASNSAYPFYSHLVEDNNGRAMALQSLGSSDLNDVTIPLGVHAVAGTALSFSITESTLPGNTEVYLEDTVTETFTLLTNESYSVIPAENLNGTGRFFLRIGNDVLSARDNELQRLHIYTLPASRELVVAGLLNEATTAVIYDLQGRMVQTQALATGVSNQHIDVAHLGTGVYIVNLDSNGGRKTQKVILN